MARCSILGEWACGFLQGNQNQPKSFLCNDVYILPLNASSTAPLCLAITFFLRLFFSLNFLLPFPLISPVSILFTPFSSSKALSLPQSVSSQHPLCALSLSSQAFPPSFYYQNPPVFLPLCFQFRATTVQIVTLSISQRLQHIYLIGPGESFSDLQAVRET